MKPTAHLVDASLYICRAYFAPTPDVTGADGASVVVTLTGHGLKDPDRAIKVAPKWLNVPANLDAVLRVLEF